MAKHLEEYTLPLEFGLHLFPEDCISIRKLYIPSSFSDYVSFYDRNGRPIYEFVVDPDNPFLKCIDGVLYTKDGKTLVAVPYKDKDFSFSVPLGVKWILEGAFQGQDNLISIDLPDGLEDIQPDVFSYCKKLKTISLPASLKHFDSNTLHHADAFEEFIVAPDNSCFVAVDGALFSKDMKTLIHFPDAKVLDTYVIPASVNRVGGHAFSACSRVRNVSLSNVSFIDMSAFEDSCINSITFSPNLVHIASHAFQRCNNLVEIDWPQNFEIISSSCRVFWQCENLARINNFPKELYIRMIMSDEYLSEHGLGSHVRLDNFLGTPFADVISDKEKEFKEQGII